MHGPRHELAIRLGGSAVRGTDRSRQTAHRRRRRRAPRSHAPVRAATAGRWAAASCLPSARRAGATICGQQGARRLQSRARLEWCRVPSSDGHLARVSRFVEARVLESDAEGLHPARDRMCRVAIAATAEESTPAAQEEPEQERRTSSGASTASLSSSMRCSPHSRLGVRGYRLEGLDHEIPVLRRRRGLERRASNVSECPAGSLYTLVQDVVGAGMIAVARSTSAGSRSRCAPASADARAGRRARTQRRSVPFCSV